MPSIKRSREVRFRRNHDVHTFPQRVGFLRLSFYIRGVLRLGGGDHLCVSLGVELGEVVEAVIEGVFVVGPFALFFVIIFGVGFIIPLAGVGRAVPVGPVIFIFDVGS
jgi:hypothetical protein